MLVFKSAFTTLSARIRELCPDVVWIDLWNDQPAHWDTEQVPLPAVLFSFTADEWKDIAATGAQTGVGGVQVHILQERYTSSHEGQDGPGEGQSNALERFDVVQAVHDALQNYAVANLFVSLSRNSGPELDPSHDALIDDSVSYATTWIDTLSQPASRQRYNVDAMIEDVTVQPNTMPAQAPVSSPLIIPL